MKLPPKTIEVENIFGSNSTNPSDHISYFGADGFPIYDEHGVEAYITYGFDCPTIGGRDFLYDIEFLLDFCLEVSDDTAKLNGKSGKSLVGEINCVELTLDGEVLTLNDPFKIQGDGSKVAFYIFVLLKKNYEKILAARNIRFKVYGAEAFFDGVIDAEAFHSYSALFYKLAEKRKKKMSQTNDYCINMFPDRISINDELSGDEELDRYELLVRKEAASPIDQKPKRTVKQKSSKETERKTKDKNGSGMVVKQSRVSVDPILLSKIDRYLTKKKMGDEFVGNSLVLKYTIAFFKQSFTDNEFQKVNAGNIGSLEIGPPHISIETIRSIMKLAYGRNEEQQHKIIKALDSELSHVYFSRYTDYQGGFTISKDEIVKRMAEDRSNFINGLFQYLLDYETETAKNLSFVSCHLGIEEKDGAIQAELLVLLSSAAEVREIDHFLVYAITPDGKRYALNAEQIEGFNIDEESNVTYERKEEVSCSIQFEQYKKHTGINVSTSAWDYVFEYTRYYYAMAYRIPLMREEADSILVPGTRISIRFNNQDIRGYFFSDVIDNWNIIKYLLGDVTVKNSVEEIFDIVKKPEELKGEIDVETIKKDVEYSYIKPIPGLEDALRDNIELQKKNPGELTCTDFNESSGTVNIQVAGKSVITRDLNDDAAINDALAVLEIYIRFFVTKKTNFPYWRRFKNSDLFKLFIVDEMELDGETMEECHVDYGEDYIGAAKLIALVVKDIYGLDESTEFIIKTWTDGKDKFIVDRSLVPYEKTVAKCLLDRYRNYKEKFALWADYSSILPQYIDEINRETFYKITEQLGKRGIMIGDTVNTSLFDRCSLQQLEDIIDSKTTVQNIIDNTPVVTPVATPVVTKDNKPARQGCYIATSVYGSYDCPQVWALRRFRDYSLDETWAGRLFIKTYYAVSPTLVKLFGGSQIFKSICLKLLDRIVRFLRQRGYNDTPYQDKY